VIGLGVENPLPAEVLSSQNHCHICSKHAGILFSFSSSSKIFLYSLLSSGRLSSACNSDSFLVIPCSFGVFRARCASKAHTSSSVSFLRN